MTGNRMFSSCCTLTSRRTFLGTTALAPAAGLLGASFLAQTAYAAALTKDQRDKLTPDQVIEAMKRGNERFRTGKMSQQDFSKSRQRSPVNIRPP
jgi:carbonic anhydrase